MAALPMIAEEIVSVVCFKTLIYCRQLCNNALNYPNTPLKEA
jgi:hypothetical protein